MNLGLEDKHALVTGSTSGIGQAIARMLLHEGASVTINGRSQSSIDRAIKQLGASDKLRGIAADVSTAEGCQSLISKAVAVAPIDILVNNAGIFEPKAFEEITDDEWTRFYNVNVLSGVRLSRDVIGNMKQNRWGRIVFISSKSGISIPVEMVHYGMTKSAQLSISRGLAKTLKDTGVTVNSVLPGPTWSDGVEEFVEKMAAG